jgi:hypothetical protein
MRRPDGLPVCGSFLIRLVALNSLTVLPLDVAGASAVPSMLKAEVRHLKIRKRTVPAMHPMRLATPTHMYIVCCCVSTIRVTLSAGYHVIE